MNKTLIAMAVAGVMAVPMAAQADATIYGKIHVSVDSGDTGGFDSGDNKSSGLFFQSNSGRVGVKGSEDLGGGLKAVWQFESNASFGSGNTSFGGRNSYVGLAGGWGSFIGGKHDTPFKTSGRWFDLFGDQVGDSRNIIQYIAGNVVTAGLPPDDSSIATNWDARPNNVLAYTSPTFGPGIDVRVAYVISDATDNANAVSAYGRWKSGDWLVGLGYESQDNSSGTSATGLRAGLQWSPGAWKMNLFYQDTSDNGGISGADFSAMGAGVAYTMGKNVLKAQYYASDISDVDNANASTIAVGWDYKMSKRTTAYLAYATTSNDSQAYNCVDAGGHGGEICGQANASYNLDTDTFAGNVNPGDDPSVFSVGMIHKF
jgi:predicted porin